MSFNEASSSQRSLDHDLRDESIAKVLEIVNAEGRKRLQTATEREESYLKQSQERLNKADEEQATRFMLQDNQSQIDESKTSNDQSAQLTTTCRATMENNDGQGSSGQKADDKNIITVAVEKVGSFVSAVGREAKNVVDKAAGAFTSKGTSDGGEAKDKEGNDEGGAEGSS